jgi:hypothetical protein
MQYVLGNMLNGAGGLNPDGLSLDLQFAADKTLTARRGPTPVFTRASTGTFVGSNGLIQTAAIDMPRFDHTSAGVCRGLLIEEGRTNSILQSENFASASWNAGTATRTSDQIAAPDGASTADLITSIAGNFGGKLAQTLSFAATTYTASVFVKKGNWRYIGITLADISNSGRVAAFDFDTETASANGVPSATIGFQKLSSGWYRIFLTLPTTAITGTFDIWMTTSTGAVIGPIGSGQTVYTWGAQLEAGSSPTSYIPTTTGSVVRSADVCSITGGDFTGMYNAIEGTFLSNSSQPFITVANAEVYAADNGADSSRFNLRHQTSFAVSQLGGVTQSIIDLSDPTANAVSKIAYAYANANYGAAKNGTLGASIPNLAVPTVNRIFIGSKGHNSSEYLNGHVAALRYYKKRLPNAKLQSLTA